MPGDIREQVRSLNTSEQTGRQLVPYDEVREVLGGIGRTTLWQLVESGELVRVKLGRRAFITAKSIDAYVDRLTEAASA